MTIPHRLSLLAASLALASAALLHPVAARADQASVDIFNRTGAHVSVTIFVKDGGTVVPLTMVCLTPNERWQNRLSSKRAFALIRAQVRESSTACSGAVRSERTIPFSSKTLSIYQNSNGVNFETLKS